MRSDPQVKNRLSLGILIVALLATAACAVAQETNDVAPAAPDTGDTEVMADKIEYFRNGSAARAAGNVVISNSMGRLSADKVIVSLDSGDMWGYGDITFAQGNRVWRGTNFYCNTRTGRVVCKGESAFDADPFRVNARAFAKKGNEVLGFDCEATTCNLAGCDRHYHLSADRITVTAGESLKAEHVIFYLWRVPFFYTPYWEKSAKGYGLGVKPGYSKRMGTYALVYYTYGLGDEWTGTTHFDYRSRRGIGLGQDFSWKDDAGLWQGNSSVYYLHDKDPINDDFPMYELGSDRYRILLRHSESITDRWRAMLRLHYLSDPELLQDFFNSEYRVEPQPENYVSFRYGGDWYSAGILARPRLNNFYEAVTRMPEVSFRVPSVQVYDSPFYYESANILGRMEKAWPLWTTNRHAYSSLRLDSRHVLLLDGQAGFLNVEPRVAYRGTYYSETPAGDSTFRSVPELGASLSFKAGRVYEDPEGADGGLRHVVEPYADYSFVPEPTVTADRLYQFDAIDAIASRHSIRLGARNKLQTLRKARPFDIVEFNLWSDGNFKREPGSHMFKQAAFDAELRPAEHVAIDCDGTYSFTGNGLDSFNTRLMYGERPAMYTEVEHRYRKDSSSLLAGTLVWSPNARWTYTTSARYEFEGKRLQEYVLWTQRNYDCMRVALGFSHVPSFTRSDGTERGAEFQVMFRLWLTAFPEIGVTVD